MQNPLSTTQYPKSRKINMHLTSINVFNAIMFGLQIANFNFIIIINQSVSKIS